MPLQVEGNRIQVLGPVPSSNMLSSTRRTRELSDIAPQYVAKSGLCNASELESSRGGSIRIQHVTALTGGAREGKSRFPKLDECAHFHYEHVEIGPLQVSIVDDEDLKPLSNETDEGKWWSLSVTSHNKTWLIRRSYENFRMLDQQLHRCIYDRKFSELTELPAERIEEQENIHKLLSDYVSRFSAIAGSLINCGPVLNWLELDNRGHRLLVPDTDNCPINTPAVAAAYSVKRYTAQAPDEISFEVGDMISVIDMPPPEESIWWRGKRGFQVGFFPCECVAVIGDKVPRNLQFSPQTCQPTKPVLRKHGKLIAFFRSFILSRPSRRKLKQSGILKERVFGCDLGEHLLNSGHEIPMVLKCCVEFIESHGLVDGIYRLSGITSNIQKLRNAFDEDRVPGLYEDEAILQDVHSVASLLKMYFRELPNPLCTYQLYHQFVGAVQATQGDDTRLLRMRDVVQKLPPPHYRTLEYLMRHLARVSEKGHETGMTSRNVAIVWAPNLLRCKELEVGGVAALQGVGVQAVVTEFLVCYADLIFCDGLPNITLPPQQAGLRKNRPKSLAISTPTKLLSLEEARTRALLQAAGNVEQDYIEVGGGPASLPVKYHTVIELPSRKRLGSKRSPIGWKLLFGKSGRGSQSRKETERKASTPSDIGLGVEKAVTELDLGQNRRRLRPAKSVESLTSNRNSETLEFQDSGERGLSSPEDTLCPMMLRSTEGKSNGHNRSVSHESYFDQLDQKEDTTLDISEIQVNFDLEESEMKIFSEDETLVSIGSGSLVSNGSPRVLPSQRCGKSLVSSFNKRLSFSKLSQGEDRLSGSQSADPSPKKQKTSDGVPVRSKLEEQLSSSVGDIQFIDSVSPDQVLVQAEVHPIQSPSPISSLSQISSSLLAPSSPILPHIPHLHRPASEALPKEGESDGGRCREPDGCERETGCPVNQAPRSHSNVPEGIVSDSESLSMQSTPETPMCRAYAPLIDLDESSPSNATTPEMEYEARKFLLDLNGDSDKKKTNLEYEGFWEKREKVVKVAGENTSDRKLGFAEKNDVQCETEKVKVPKPEERKPKPVHPYANIPIIKPEPEPRKMLETSFDLKENSEKNSNRNSIVSIRYECFSTESSCDSLVGEYRITERPLLEDIKSENDVTTPESDVRPSVIEEPEILRSGESAMILLRDCNNWLRSQSEFCKEEDADKVGFPLSEGRVGDGKRETEEFRTAPPHDSEREKERLGVLCGALVKDVQSGSDASLEVECESLNLPWEGPPSPVSECLKKLEGLERSLTDNHDETEDGESLASPLVTDFPLVEEFTEKVKVLEESSGGQNLLEERKEKESASVDSLLTVMADELVEEKDMWKEPPQRKKASQESIQKEKVLETNLDDLEFFLKTEEISPNRSQRLEKKPIPKKRTLPQKSNSSGNVRQLLSKFEKSPTVEKEEQGGTIRGRESSSALRTEEERRPKTLERLSTNRRTEKELRESRIPVLEKSRSGSHIEEERRTEGSLGYDFDMSDPQRRERIEKYKEKRRNYLREKYRSDSFKNEKDDFSVKVRQRHVRRGESEEVKLSTTEAETSNVLGKRSSLPKTLENSSREICRRSFSADISGKPRHEDGDRKRSHFLRFAGERKSANDLRSPEKKNHSIEFFVSETHLNDNLSPPSLGTSYTRRRMTDPSRPSARGSSEESSVRSSVNRSDKLPGGEGSSSSIKDMAAMFEKRDDYSRNQKKQYLSSV